MIRPVLLALALLACDRSAPKQDSVARDLSRALEPAPTESVDTAEQRKRDQLERCKFVYHDEQGLRECLVLKNGWAPQDAAREIAIYKAEISRTVDSLRAVGDSIRGEVRAKMRREDAYAAKQPYWGHIRSKTYFTNTPNCETLQGFTFAELRFFKSPAEAERARFSRSDQPGC